MTKSINIKLREKVSFTHFSLFFTVRYQTLTKDFSGTVRHRMDIFISKCVFREALSIKFNCYLVKGKGKEKFTKNAWYLTVKNPRRHGHIYRERH